MTEFDEIKRRYTFAIQLGLSCNVGYQLAMMGNDVLHECFKSFVDNSCYDIVEKNAMKLELDAIKESLAEEIKMFYDDEQQE